MLTTRSPITRRIPLQPKTTPPNQSSSQTPHPNPRKPIPISPIHHSNNKENHPNDTEVSSIDPSLAEELNSVRRRLNKLRLDSLTTERMLRLRDRIFEFRYEELMLRGEFQKKLESEVDRLYRLKQIQLSSMRKTPIRSLRERSKESSSSRSKSSPRKEGSGDRSVTVALSFSSDSV